MEIPEGGHGVAYAPPPKKNKLLAKKLTLNFQCVSRAWDFYPKVTTYVRVFAIANPSVVCHLPVVRNVRAIYSGGWTFRNIFSPFCTLAILWPTCKMLRKSSQGNSPVGGIKRKRGSKLEWWWTYRRLYHIPMSRSGLLYHHSTRHVSYCISGSVRIVKS